MQADLLLQQYLKQIKEEENQEKEESKI